MKRGILVILLATGLVALAFANGQSESASKHVTLIDYHWTETTYDPLMEHLVKVFEDSHPNVTVKLLLLPDAQRAAKIRTALAANGDIDVAALNNGESASFLSEDQLRPIDPAGFGKQTLTQVRDMFIPGSFKATGAYWKGKYYGAPFELSNYVAWINTADMKAAGLSPSSDIPKTWQQFSQIGQKLIVTNGGIRVRNGFENNSKQGVFNFLVLTTIMQQLGLDWGTESGLIASMSHTATLIRGLSTYTDFVTKSKIWDPALNQNDRSGFGNNKTAMFLTGGAWYWGVLDTYSVPRKDVQPFPYPRFSDGKDIGGPGYGYAEYVTKLSKHPKTAWEWINTMTSDPNAFMQRGLHQARVTLSNGKQGLNSSLSAKDIPYWKQVFEPELQKTSVWLSSTKGNQVTDAVWAAISRVIYQNVSPAASVAQLQSAIKSIFE